MDGPMERNGKRSPWSFPELSKYATAHLVISIAMMVVIIALQGAIAGLFVRQIDLQYTGVPTIDNQTSNQLPYLIPDTAACNATSNDNNNNANSIVVYLIIFILSQVFQCYLVIDALWQQNSLQLMLHDVFAAAMLSYSAVEYNQLQLLLSPCALNVQYRSDSYLDFSSSTCNPGCQMFRVISPLIATTIAVLALCLIVFLFLTQKLYNEYGFKKTKKVSARQEAHWWYFHYQVYVMLNKANIFFFETFSIQYLYLILKPSDPEYGLTILIILLAIPIVAVAWWAVTSENYRITFVWIIVLFLLMAYYIFKFTRIFQDPAKYVGYGRFLLLFAFLGVAVAIAQIIFTIICLLNFGKGLKDLLTDDVEAERVALE